MKILRKLRVLALVIAGLGASGQFTHGKGRPHEARKLGRLQLADEDPFADMIEEGAGLLNQWKAEAWQASKRTLRG